jgi:hypothetical protein
MRFWLHHAAFPVAVTRCNTFRNFESSSDEISKLTARYFSGSRSNLQGYKLGLPIAMFMNFSSNLLRLAVEDAGLYGDFPQNMADKYPNLINLAFSFNNITGTLPASIGNMSQLAALFVQG